ncbi:MAG: Crp/Fnr family transcriptional regulator [Phyllobacteriaceae bacterium]|nr:Crp/Fnr family transcriptional regulator [Phyllobacteriaceae bacterium]
MVTSPKSEAPAPAVSPGKSTLPAVLQSGALSSLEDSAKDLILKQMLPLHLAAGQRAFRPGFACSNYIVVKKGSVKVSVFTESGREIVLYRVQDGETCVLTTAGLLSGEHYDAEGIAETDTDAIILPKAVFEDLLATSPGFRRFVFSSYGERLQSLIGLVQEVAVRHVDRRLARHLLRVAKAGVVEATHQTLANDLHTAREVVTRLLNDFAEKGWVELVRGRVTVADPQALEDFASRT